MMAICRRLNGDDCQSSATRSSCYLRGLRFPSWSSCLHAVVLRPAAPFGGHPGDHLVRIHDVARLAVHAVRGVDLQPWCSIGPAGNLIDIRWTESRARV